MRICIAGGDKRMVAAAELFTKEGYECVLFGFDRYNNTEDRLEYTEDISYGIQGSQGVILPFPCQKDGFLNTPFSGRKIEIESIFSFDDGKRLFFGGKLPFKGDNIVDYSQNEDFLWHNAVPTAEGALDIAMKELETTVHGAEITVVGYGRIGSCLTRILHSLGARVTVVARSAKSRTPAEILGVNAVGFDRFEAPLSCADIVFNTVPSKVIGENELASTRPGTAIIDLASLPGGADEKECEKYGIRLIRALGLPGRVAPKTAGKAIFQTVLPILKDRGIIP